MSKCLRKLVYGITPPRPVSNNSPFRRRKFAVGHMVHDWVQKDFTRWAENSGQTVHFEREVKISPALSAVASLWEIHSSADGVFTLRDSEGYETLRVLLEIKTMSKDEFAKLKEPDPDHVEQVHVYMKALNIPFCWVFYWNKDNHTYTSPAHEKFLLNFDPFIWERIEKRIAAAYEFKDKGEFPDREEGFHCELCAWKRICQPQYLEPKVKSMAQMMPKNMLRMARKK